jgi:FG-GAP-like repeat
MEHGELKTHLWNLSRGLVTGIVIAACGPQIIESGQACESNGDCPEGQLCVDEVCVEENCGSAACCNYSYDCYYEPYDPYYEPYDDTGTDTYADTYTDTYTDTDTDTETSGPECRSSADCSLMQVCSPQGTCDDVPALPPCAEVPTLVVQDLPTASEAEFVSLAFVDANGDAAQDLVVGRNGGAELLLGPGDGPPIALPVNELSVTSAAAGDLDGDGDAELVLATEEGLVLVLTGDGAGNYVEAAIQEVGGPLRDLATLQWDGDQLLDVVGRVEGSGAVLLWGDAMGGFSSVAYLATDVPVISLVRSDFDADALGDVVLQDDGGIRRFQGSELGDLLDDGLLPNSEDGARMLASAAIDGGAPLEVVGVTYLEERSLVELWPQGLDGPQLHLLAGSRRAAGMGDFDGDGMADLMVGGDFVVDYVRGSEGPSWACASPVESPVSLLGMAVGDFDGNARADVVIASARGITRLASQ